MDTVFSKSFTYIIGGYLSGSLLFSEFFMKLFHKKSLFTISKNHNPGASNAFIYGGPFCGFLSAIFDLLKGFIPVTLFCRDFGYQNYSLGLMMLAPILGHAYSCFYHFKGGMSITVSFGVLIGIFHYSHIFLLLALLFLSLLCISNLNNSQRTIIAYSSFVIISMIETIQDRLPFNVLIGVICISCIICGKMWPEVKNQTSLKE